MTLFSHFKRPGTGREQVVLFERSCTATKVDCPLWQSTAS